MILRILCFFLFIGMISGVQAQERDCSIVHDGSFFGKDNSVGSVRLERKGNKQVEYYDDLKLKAVFKITWISTCTYELRLKKILENPLKITFNENQVVTTEILELGDGYYRFRVRSSGSSEELIGKMYFQERVDE